VSQQFWTERITSMIKILNLGIAPMPLSSVPLHQALAAEGPITIVIVIALSISFSLSLSLSSLFLFLSLSPFSLSLSLSFSFSLSLSLRMRILLTLLCVSLVEGKCRIYCILMHLTPSDPPRHHACALFVSTQSCLLSRSYLTV
jgi:hypothetical protein